MTESINQTGQSLESLAFLDNKYNINFSKQDIEKDIQRLTNQLWKLIPMRENNENWNKQLETVIIELVGLKEIFPGAELIQILSKIEGLRNTEASFELYRKTVFECINLLRGRN